MRQFQRSDLMKTKDITSSIRLSRIIRKPISISFFIPGDSNPDQQTHRRQISGYVNHHRPLPPRQSSTTEPQRSSISQQNSVVHNDQTDLNSPKR